MQTQQTKPLDSDTKFWGGVWFSPSIGQRYQVPANAANHRDYLGCAGECIGRRFNQFGMSWAYIHFEKIKNPDIEKKAWIRTMFLIGPLDD